jgi:NAD(P)H-dependent FMN reductase
MSSRRALNILGIGGSLRKASNTAGILRYAKANAPKHINL